MEDAEIVGRTHERWIVQAQGGRRYFLFDDQIVGPVRPEIGLRGEIGYVQGMVTARLTFVPRDSRP